MGNAFLRHTLSFERTCYANSDQPEDHQYQWEETQEKKYACFTQ